VLVLCKHSEIEVVAAKRLGQYLDAVQNSHIRLARVFAPVLDHTMQLRSIADTRRSAKFERRSIVKPGGVEGSRCLSSLAGTGEDENHPGTVCRPQMKYTPG